MKYTMVSAVIPRLIITAASAVVLLAAHQINAEYRQFDGIIQAAASYIHYSEGFVIAPASIDISNLEFSTIDDDSGGGGPMKNGVDQSSSYSSSGGGATSGDSTGIPKEYTDDEEQGEWNDNDDTTGALKVGEDDDNRQLGELAINEGGSVVDIVIFQEV